LLFAKVEQLIDLASILFAAFVVCVCVVGYDGCVWFSGRVFVGATETTCRR